MPAIEFRGVDIIFGKEKRRSLELIDRGKTRDEILAATGAVLGAAGVNLAIDKGEICVLMGLSGSGKSTILRAVNGLNKVARGMLPPSRIAMVFQQFALLPWRTVRENVGFGLELRGLSKAEIERIVDE